MKYLRIMMVLMIALLVTACGAQREIVTPESMVDQPLFHIQGGFEMMDRMEFDNAAVSFERAVAIDPENAQALAGEALAVLWAEQDTSAAEELARQALRHDDRNPYAYIVKAQLEVPGYLVPIVIDNQLGVVHEEAHEELLKALEYGENDSRAKLYAARLYIRLLDFRKAKDLLTELAAGDDFESQANRCLRRINQVERLAPTTDLGKAIALMQEVSHAEAAALISLELHPGRYLTEYEINIPDDIAGHWASNALTEMVTTGLFELDMDGHGNPDQPLTREEYALACVRMMAGFANDPPLAARYMDSQVGYDDLGPTNPSYSAARTVVENGLLTAEDGNFHPDDPVSGADILEMVSWLRERYERSF